MTCNCGSDRIIKIEGKCSDMCCTSYDGEHVVGYAPAFDGIRGGDYLGFSFCADCGLVQNFKPISDESIELTMSSL